jgi:hypothetical protein
MDGQIFYDLVAPAAASFFPPTLNTPRSRAMILAIGLQESQFKHRQQLIGGYRDWWKSITGPAVSFFQFEKIGIRGVLEHPASRDMALELIGNLGYPEDVNVLWKALRHNDILAAGFARLALWRLPSALPDPDEGKLAWLQYVDAWRPGKPHPERWGANWVEAWEIVLNDPG